MHPTLATIPPEILDAIFSFVYSQIVVDLWLSGDRMVQRNISQGVTSIHLLNTQRYTLNRFPKMIAQLPKLRSLVVDRGGRHLLHSQEVSQFLQALPSTLTKLVLAFEDSSSVLLPYDDDLSDTFSSDDHDDTIRDASWSLATAFPHLQTLEVANDHQLDWASLPPLTSLTIGLPYDDDEAVDGTPEQERMIRSLPRQLLHLNIIDLYNGSPINPTLWRHLPPNLLSFTISEELFVREPTSHDVGHLPRTLTSLELHQQAHIEDSESYAKALPPLLRTLHEGTFNGGDIDFPNIGLIFPSLTRAWLLSSTLGPADQHNMILYLPRTVTDLAVSLKGELMEKKHWPPHLTALELKESGQNFLPILPSGLLSLTLHEECPLQNASDISLLPRSLTILNAWFKESTDELIAFPPRLTGLTLFVEEDLVASLTCFPLRSLPSSVVQLTLMIAIPASQLKHLPPHLELLNIESLVIDSDYHPREELRSLLASVKHRETENFAWDDLHEASLSSLLPRSLTCLFINGEIESQATYDWSHLPISPLSLSASNYLAGKRL